MASRCQDTPYGACLCFFHLRFKFRPRQLALARRFGCESASTGVSDVYARVHRLVPATTRKALFVLNISFGRLVLNTAVDQGPTRVQDELLQV